MPQTQGVEVTLSSALYRHLWAEAKKLGVSIHWLVASMIVDTFESTEPVAA